MSKSSSRTAEALGILNSAGNAMIWDAYATLATARGIFEEDAVIPDDVEDDELEEAANEAMSEAGSGLACLALLAALAQDGCLEDSPVWDQINDAIKTGLRAEIEGIWEEFNH